MKSEVMAKIVDSELQVMHLLWNEKHSMTVTEIQKALMPSTGWASSTIKTLVYRLAEKGVLHVDKSHTAKYSPFISEEEYNQYATRVLIEKLYGGSAKNLVAALVNTKTLGETDIAELRNMFKVGE